MWCRRFVYTYTNSYTFQKPILTPVLCWKSVVMKLLLRIMMHPKKGERTLWEGCCCWWRWRKERVVENCVCCVCYSTLCTVAAFLSMMIKNKRRKVSKKERNEWLKREEKNTREKDRERRNRRNVAHFHILFFFTS